MPMSMAAWHCAGALDQCQRRNRVAPLQRTNVNGGDALRLCNGPMSMAETLYACATLQCQRRRRIAPPQRTNVNGGDALRLRNDSTPFIRASTKKRIRNSNGE